TAYILILYLSLHDALPILRDFIKKNIKYGDNKVTLYKIERGKIKPSKSLQDSLSSMLKGNEEFVMIDEQKVVFEEALALSKKARSEEHTSELQSRFDLVCR